MIPRLYAPGTTDFSSNGIGPLPDCARCIVTEERNGSYELEMDYVIGGLHYGDIEEDCIIVALPAEGKTPQGFRIYKITRLLSGLITVYAEHISYILNGLVCAPFTAVSCANTLAKLKTECVETCPFDFWTDKEVNSTFTLEVPKTIRSMLSGSTGSVLQVYGTGEYEFDNYLVKLYLHRGQDRGVTIRYGKNLSEMTHETDATNVYTGIAPYWMSGEDDGGDRTIVTLPEVVVESTHVTDYAHPIIKPVDFSSAWQEAPTEAQLRAKAQQYVADNEGWNLDTNITVSFVALWQTEEYKNIAALQRVYLCDTVNIEYTKLGVSASAKVVKTVFDSLRERYTEIELGNIKQTLGSELVSDAVSIVGEDLQQQIIQTKTTLTEAIEHATQLIQGGLGGHVLFGLGSDGEPNEILIMDTEDKNTATNVIRMNVNGIGFSTTGYQGPFSTAWTIDGNFNADFITAGEINAALVKVGTLQDESGRNSWNMETGQMNLADAYVTVGGTAIITAGNLPSKGDDLISSINLSSGSGVIQASKLTLAGKTLQLTSDEIAINSTNFQLTKDGNLTCQNANVTGTVSATTGSIGGFTIDNGNLKSETSLNSGIWFHINTAGSIMCARVSDGALYGIMKIGTVMANDFQKEDGTSLLTLISTAQNTASQAAQAAANAQTTADAANLTANTVSSSFNTWLDAWNQANIGTRVSTLEGQMQGVLAWIQAHS